MAINRRISIAYQCSRKHEQPLAWIWQMGSIIIRPFFAYRQKKTLLTEVRTGSQYLICLLRTVCVFFGIIIDGARCTWPISTNPASKEAGELGANVWDLFRRAPSRGCLGRCAASVPRVSNAATFSFFSGFRCFEFVRSETLSSWRRLGQGPTTAGQTAGREPAPTNPTRCTISCARTREAWRELGQCEKFAAQATPILELSSNQLEEIFEHRQQHIVERRSP